MSIKGFQINGTTQKYDYNALDNKPTIPAGAVVDATFSTTSTNAVQNKVITSAIGNLADLDTTAKGNLVEAINEVAENGGGGSGGTTNYNYLSNKPSINGVELRGDKTAAELGLVTPSDIPASVSAVPTMPNVQYIGKLFDTGYDYSSWVHNNVKYDPINDVICVIVNNADAHVNATLRDILLYKIDPRTLEIVDKIVVNDSKVSGKQFEVYGFCILSDGRYMFMPCFDTGVSQAGASKCIVWTSDDYGETWTETEATVTGLASQSAYEWFGITALASGRLLCIEYKTKSILHSDDDGETWTAQAMQNSTHEPTFIDCGNDRILCICRKTMYGTNNGSWNGQKQIEPAVYHKSTDGGANWTSMGDSTTITEMTASNAACVVDNGYATLYVCSRYPHGDKAGAIFQYHASLDNAFNDAWGTSKVIWYPTAPTFQDFSYIGAAKDSQGIQHIFYYDADVTDYAEIRYLMAAQSNVPVPVNADKTNALSIPYSSSQTDALLSKLKAELNSRINELIIAGGGDIDDEMDGSFYITDHLYEAFDFMDSSKYDAETRSQTGLKKVFPMKRSTATWGDSAPSDTSFEAWSGITWRTNGFNFQNTMTSAKGYTVEVLVKNDSSTLAASSGSHWPVLDSNNNYGQNFQHQASGAYNWGYYFNTENGNGNYNMSPSITSGEKPIVLGGKEYTHNVYIVDSTGIYIYQNGVLTMQMVYSEIADFGAIKSDYLVGFTFQNSADAWHTVKMRYYDKPLSAAEVKNNYKYESSQF